MIKTTCVAVVLASAGAAFAQNSIQLDITTSPRYDAAGNEVDGRLDAIIIPEGVGGTFRLMVSAIQVGQAQLNGISTFDGNVNPDGVGSISQALLTNTEAIGAPVPGDDFDGRTGMLPEFRSTMGLNNSDPGNGIDNPDGSVDFLPLSIVNGGNGEGPGEVIDVYVISLTIDPSQGQGEYFMTVSANAGGVWVNGDLETVAVSGDTLRVLIVPAPGAAALMALGGLVATRRRR